MVIIAVRRSPLAMTQLTTTSDSAATAEGIFPLDVPSRQPGIVGLYMELTKARLSALVLLTTAVGFVLAVPVPGAWMNWRLLMFTMLGTALAACAAAVLNQLFEADRDARMNRTMRRPIPSGSITRSHAFVAGVLMGYIGVAILALFVNLLAAGLALLTIVLYVAVYTPMKPRSTLNTLVGAVCGAIPPMIGWVAATGELHTGAWILAIILFVWQLPHFLALAWLYREDYARGGFVMLPLLDPRGELTARVIVITSLMLLPLGMMSVALGLAGWWFAVGSIALALWMCFLSVKFYRERSDANARRVFLASIVYLSVLLGLFIADRGPLSSGGELLAHHAMHTHPDLERNDSPSHPR